MQIPDDLFTTLDASTMQAVQTMLVRLEDSQKAMELARKELEQDHGHGEQALAHAFRAGRAHADFHRAVSDLEAVGLDSIILLEHWHHSHAAPDDVRRASASPPAKPGA